MYTSRTGLACAALSMALPIVANGKALLPLPVASLPVVETKYARAASPSTPSQLESKSARSGRSGAPGWTAGSSGAQSSAVWPSPSKSGAARAPPGASASHVSASSSAASGRRSRRPDASDMRAPCATPSAARRLRGPRGQARDRALRDLLGLQLERHDAAEHARRRDADLEGLPGPEAPVLLAEDLEDVDGPALAVDRALGGEAAARRRGGDGRGLALLLLLGLGRR